MFQHTAARRRLASNSSMLLLAGLFQHTAARRRLAFAHDGFKCAVEVSTHSRPKAAGRPPESGRMVYRGFNTQPPEGGWRNPKPSYDAHHSFNTQPPEGGWFQVASTLRVSTTFQHTAARRRLGRQRLQYHRSASVSTHSRPKAAGDRFNVFGFDKVLVSTHSRPKAAGKKKNRRLKNPQFQHTAARRRLGVIRRRILSDGVFQHTAARRRLGLMCRDSVNEQGFQHTAARRRLGGLFCSRINIGLGFNTQPPEGGWM